MHKVQIYCTEDEAQEILKLEHDTQQIDYTCFEFEKDKRYMYIKGDGTSWHLEWYDIISDQKTNEKSIEMKHSHVIPKEIATSLIKACEFPYVTSVTVRKAKDNQWILYSGKEYRTSWWALFSNAQEHKHLLTSQYYQRTLATEYDIAMHHQLQYAGAV